MLELESDLRQKLVVKIFEKYDTNANYSEVIPFVDQDKHPILNQYISFKSRQIKEANNHYY
jgi:hypothetical protein